MSEIIITGTQLAYLVAASFFIIGLRYLISPLTARRGNIIASCGMVIAIIVTLFDFSILNYQMIFLAILVGSLIGGTIARTIKMTAMPQMVGLLNGFGGGASALVALAEFQRLSVEKITVSNELVAIFPGIIIGGATFSGSLVAFGKLQGIVRGTPITFPLQNPINFFLMFVFVAASIFFVIVSPDPSFVLVLVGVALLLGVLLVIPIGGADMPVVISMLNSFSGLAASTAGFVLGNNMLIIAGALVGASGIILTSKMCKSMNRSLPKVLFGAVGAKKESMTTSGEKNIRTIHFEEGAMILGYAKSVIIIPGFGMAVAQAQQAVFDLAERLGKRGVSVKFAIHPVAGRMPGHMNVLLADAKVPYSQLYDLDDINPEFERTDVALVLGANDVVNPEARHNKSSPIYGMPILDADKARHIIVVKRSMNPGFAGVDNELFYNKNTTMLFGDARDVVTKLSEEINKL
jgi:H+-translocating NAD(P) transhydrogenase subunit beta